MADTEAKNRAIVEEHKRKYYEDIPYVTPRVQAAIDQAEEEFSKGDVVGNHKIIGSQAFLKDDGRIYFRTQRLDRKRRKTQWTSLTTLRQARTKDANARRSE